MILFHVGSEEKADEVLSKVTYFTLAESLGAVESRVLIGIEDSEDLNRVLNEVVAVPCGKGTAYF